MFILFNIVNNLCMKKLFIFFLLIILLCGLNFYPLNKTSINDLFHDAKYEIYTYSQSGLNIDKIANGNGEIVFCNSSNVEETLKKLNDNISGFTIEIDKENIDYFTQKNINKILKNNYKINNEIYGKSNFFKKNVKINNKNVNFQYKEVENKILIGTPILLGSY